MNFKKGQFVIVTDFKDRKLPRRVWSDEGQQVVLIASEDVYRALEAGEVEAQPVAFRREDVSPVEDDSGQVALKQVEAVTGAPAPTAEELLGSEELKRQYREAKKRL